MIVLDTHAWLWWQAKSKHLSRRAQSEIEQAKSIGIPAICCWEVAMLVARGRLELDREILVWIKQALIFPKTQLLPLSPEIAISSQRLEDFHSDPADCMIVATALEHQATLISKDRKIAAFSKVKAPRGEPRGIFERQE